MGEKPESDEFEDEEPAEPVPGTEDVDLDRAIKDMEIAKRRGQKLGEPAWRGSNGGASRSKPRN